MYISKIHIQNYRNFGDFTMEFHKGLNVIIGANNSGKTGLLHAINADNVADFDKFRHDVSEELEKLLSPSITKLTALFENEKNAIGLEKGNVSSLQALVE